MMYAGTSIEQDNRFSDKAKKFLKQTKFDNSLTKPVDMTKVRLDVIKPWISQKITELIGEEDEIIVLFVFNQLETKFPDPKKMQMSLIGFLDRKNARMFMGELWELLLSAQESDNGIPEQFMEKKEEEVKKQTDTSIEQDTRFNDKTKKLLKQMKFNNILKMPVDMTKVRLDAIKPWISQKITKLNGLENEIIVDFVFNQLEPKFPDPKKIQINLMGFLSGENAEIFMGELWELLLSAQESDSGIPRQLMERKKEEIKKQTGTFIEQDTRQDKANKLLKEIKFDNSLKTPVTTAEQDNQYSYKVKQLLKELNFENDMNKSGTTADQNSQFNNDVKKLLKQLKFENDLKKPVDMTMVRFDVIKPWISQKITDMLNIDDDDEAAIVNYVFNQLQTKLPDSNKLHIKLIRFLGEKNAQMFMGELWELLLSAQESVSGIPKQLTAKKKGRMELMGTTTEYDNQLSEKVKKLLKQLKVENELIKPGTTPEQVNRFNDKVKKILKQLKFENNLTKPVDMTNVKLYVIKPWILRQITEVLGIEDDDVIIPFVFNQLETKFPDAKKMLINLTEFLNEKIARMFMGKLWELLLSAQESDSGIPEQFLEKKIEEIKEEMDSTRSASRQESDRDWRDKDTDRDHDRDRSRSRSRRRDSKRCSPHRDKAHPRRRSRSREQSSRYRPSRRSLECEREQERERQREREREYERERLRRRASPRRRSPIRDFRNVHSSTNSRRDSSTKSSVVLDYRAQDRYLSGQF